MRRIVIDANVWVSAILNPTSIPDQVIELVRSREMESILSQPLIDQVIRTLTRLRVSDARIGTAISDLIGISTLVTPDQVLTVITTKESDNRVLECAVAGGADVIVTGDRKHLLRLGNYDGIPIISPREFVDTFP